MPEKDELEKLMDSDNESESDTDEWDSAQRATELLYSKHGAEVDRSLDPDCPWCMTIGLLQLARSTGWKCHFVGIAVRQIIRLTMAIIVQLTFVWYFGYSLMTIGPYGGAPWLCNMGKGFMTCQYDDPPHEDCIGPGGRLYHKDDLFSDFNVWSTRMYVRDSLRNIFSDNPVKTNLINDNVVPGEYGIEDDYCRWICLALLGIQVQAELRDVIQLIVTICMLPTTSMPWLKYLGPLDTKHDELDGGKVRFYHGGMPIYMKILSLFIIGVRFFIAFYVGALGVRFLLNTPAIADLIFNSLALTFIFDLAGLVQDAWSSKEPKTYMNKLEGFTTDREHCYTRFCDCIHSFSPFPVEFFLAAIFIACTAYYNIALECGTSVLGGLASDAVFAVAFGHYSIFPFFQETTTSAQWCPPDTLIANATCVK